MARNHCEGGSWSLWALTPATCAEALRLIDPGGSFCGPEAETAYCFGPTVPVCFKRSERTQPETSLPILGLMYITDDQPSLLRA